MEAALRPVQVCCQPSSCEIASVRPVSCGGRAVSSRFACDREPVGVFDRQPFYVRASAYVPKCEAALPDVGDGPAAVVDEVAGYVGRAMPPSPSFLRLASGDPFV